MADRLTRRQVLAGSGGALTLTVLPRALSAASVPETGDLRDLFKTHFGDQVPPPGGVRLDVSRLVESGLSVAVSVRGDDPQDPPEALFLFMPRNPEPWGLEAHFHPPALPELATRIRLSATQNLTAVGRWADGRLGLDGVTVLVTRGACIDENYGQWVR